MSYLEMGNTQSIFVLYVIVLSFFFWIDGKQTTATWRQGTVKGTAEINQPRSFKNTLTSKYKSKGK